LKKTGILKTNFKLSVTELIVLLAFFAFFCALAFLFPRSGDDWAWGSSIGIERFNNGFALYNGRYFGNFLVLALTRIGVVAQVFEAAAVTALLYLILKTGSSGFEAAAPVCAFLLMAIPKAMFRQVFTWVSGFTNYVPPVLLTLFVFYQFSRVKKERGRRLQFALVSAAAFSAQLFMEHNTVYAVAASAVIVLLCLWLKKEAFGLSVCYALSSLAGAAVMFSNGAYREIASGGDAYRNVVNGSESMPKILLDKLEGSIAPGIITGNTVLIVTVCLLGMTAVTLAKNKNDWLKIPVNIAYTAVGLVTVYKALSPNSLNRINLLNAAVFAAAVLLTAVLFVEQKEIRFDILFLTLSAAVLTFPLLFVNPIGPRCYFGQYVLIIMAGKELFNAVALSSNAGQKKPGGIKALAALTACAAVTACSVRFAGLFRIYGDIHKADTQRTAYITAEVKKGSKEITVPKLPRGEGEYVHCADPNGFPWHDRFKLYHGFPEDVRLKLVDYSHWLQIKN